MAEKKLYLLDGMALIYRAYFALKDTPRLTSYGLNTNAMFGFTNVLLEVLNKQKPTHIAVVFDTAAPTQRHIDFAAYKAQREEMPEDLKRSLPYIFRIIEGFRIPVIAMDGFEADDVIGTLAWKCGDMGMDVFMMTPDKDYGQLVRENVYIYKPGRFGNPSEVLGVQEILTKWEIKDPMQVIDILGLWGDASDNIPGVPGVGEKTAKKLIADYGNMEGIYEHIEELKGKQKENFINFKEQALISKKLATIITDVPVEFDEEKYVLEPMDTVKLKEVFNELEFRQLSQRVFGESTTGKVVQPDLFSGGSAAQAAEEAPVPEPTNFKTIESTPHNYMLVQQEPEWAMLMGRLEKCAEFAFDTETTSLNVFEAQIVGISFSVEPGEAFYIPLRGDEIEKSYFERLKPFLEGPKLKIAQNAKFDMAILKKYGIHVSAPIFDTMLAHYLLEPDSRHNMNYLSEAYLNYRPVSIEDLIGKKGKNQGNMANVELEKIKEYAAEDSDIALQLKRKFEKELDKRNVRRVFEDVELPLLQVLVDIEEEGIRLDADFLNLYSKDLGEQSGKIQQEIFGLAGAEFLISSPQQVGKILFDKLKLIDKPKKTKTGQYQTDEETLMYLANEHDIVRRILDYRGVQKLKSTYVDALPTMVNAVTGRLHTSFNQAVAATGRLSSNNPNLQNIPIRTEMGREVRKAFIPRDPEHVLLSADYSQIELRVIAHVSKDAGMIEAFKNGLDIHTATAAKVFGVKLEEVDSEMRRKAKTVNFGIIYGISAFGLSQRIGIPRSEAKEIIDNYFMQFPGIKNYMDTTMDFAREHGYVETLLGRRRYIRDINSRNATVRGFAERNSINAPIQGGAADMIKVAMINVHKWLKGSGLKTKMILQVHDELLFDVPKDEVDIVQPKIIELMANALVLDVPVLVEAGTGVSWLEAH